MTGIRVAALGGREIDRLADLHALCFDEPWSADTVRQVLGTVGAFGLAGRIDGADAPAGFALARVVLDECELLSLGVAPDRRRRGLGAALLDAAMARAAAFGARWFLLEVGTDNGPARRLYASRGMVGVGRRPGYYPRPGGATEDAVTMRCDLCLPAPATFST